MERGLYDGQDTLEHSERPGLRWGVAAQNCMVVIYYDVLTTGPGGSQDLQRGSVAAISTEQGCDQTALRH